MEYGNIQVAAAPVKKDKRKLATAREKRRMEKLNHCIEDLRVLICPSLKGPTKAKVLRASVDRLRYLEHLYRSLTQDRVVSPVQHPVKMREIQIYHQAEQRFEPVDQQRMPEMQFSDVFHYEPEIQQTGSPESGYDDSPVHVEQEPLSQMVPVEPCAPEIIPAQDFRVEFSTDFDLEDFQTDFQMDDGILLNNELDLKIEQNSPKSEIFQDF